MRRDVCYFFPVDVVKLYNAYLTAAENDRFRRECTKEPYHTLGFGLNFSMKYNFNGGACTLRFMPWQGGSAVNLRFSMAQLAGARYEKYALDLTDTVVQLLGVPAHPFKIDVEAFMLPVNKVTPQSVAQASAAAVPAVPTARVAEKICLNCGLALGPNDRFCSGCGRPAPADKKFCTGCGKEAAVGAAFCSACGNKL